MRRLWTIGLALLCFTACSNQAQETPLRTQPSPSASPFTITMTIEHLPFDTPQRMCTAEFVTVATVASWGATHWNTPGATRPDNLSSIAVEGQQFQIYRPLQLSGSEVLIDHRPAPQQELAAVGGTVGQDTITTNYPTPLAGQRYLLIFVPGQRSGVAGPDYSTLILIDAFRIDDRDNILFPRGAIMANGQDVPGGFVPAPLAGLRTQLKSCPTGG